MVLKSATEWRSGMRLMAYAAANEICIGVYRDGEVAEVAMRDQFYQDVATYTERILQGKISDWRVASETRAVVPVPLSAKVLCVGLNYRRHAEEAGMKEPKAPDIFGRWSTSLIGNGEPSPIPARDEQYDWEGELAVVVGRRLRAASVNEANDAILGYTCFNDLSARGYQLRTTQWTLGKNGDRSAPIGPVIVSPEELGDPYALKLETRVNSEVVQSSSTKEMIRQASEIMAYVSGVMTLEPGDVIALGTPEGIGHACKPPRYLVAGDIVEVEIERIGVLRTPIERE